MKFLIIIAFFLAAVSANPMLLRPGAVDVIDGNGRITNGSTASERQFPYQVSLSLQYGVLSRAWCSASLISKSWILTAAHCADDVSSGIAYLGTTKRNFAQITRLFSSRDIRIIPTYESQTLTNDISLINIAPVTLSPSIQPVALPSETSTSNYVGDDVIATGWGRTSDSSGMLATNLQYGRMKVVRNGDCSNFYGADFIDDSKICASTLNGVSTCNGDSGGPLTLESPVVQIGVTSFGSPNGCEKHDPVVFTRVGNYLDWIKSQTGVSY